MRLEVTHVLLIVLAVALCQGAAGQARVAAVDSASGRLLVADVAGGGLLDLTLPEAPSGVAVHPSGSPVYVSSTAGIVFEVDPGSGAVRRHHVLDGTLLGLTVTLDGTRVLVAAPYENRVLVLDAGTLDRLDAIPIDEKPVSVVVHPSGSKAYVLKDVYFGHYSGAMDVVDLGTNELLSTVSTGALSRDAAVAWAGDRGLTADAGSSCGIRGGYSLFDAEDDVSLQRVGLGHGTAGAAISPDGAEGYLGLPSCSGEAGVLLLDLETGTVEGSVATTAGHVNALALDPTGTRLAAITRAVLDPTASSLTILDTSDWGVEWSVSLGSGEVHAWHVAVTPRVSTRECGPDGAESLVFSYVPPSQESGVPFAVEVAAVDEEGHRCEDGYTGPVRLTPSVGSVTPILLDMERGLARGEVALDTACADVVLSATGFGLSGVSNLFDVTGLGLPGWIAGEVGQWSMADGYTVEAPAGTTVRLRDGEGNESTVPLVDGRFRSDPLPCGEYSVRAEEGEASTEWHPVAVPFGRTAIRDLLLPDPLCDTSGLTPVLLLPGMLGSTTSEGALLPDLPTRRVSWDDDAWPRWFWPWWLAGRRWALGSLGGLHPAPGWDDLVERLQAVDSRYAPYCGVFPVPYDWRLHPWKVAERYLEPRLDQVKELTGAETVHVVAHSMGGLVARAYVEGRSYGDDVDRLALVGTPNHGALMAYYLWAGKPFEAGWSRGLVYKAVLERMYQRQNGWYGITARRLREYVRSEVASVGSLLPVYPSLDHGAVLDALQCSQDWPNRWLEELNRNSTLPHEVVPKIFAGGEVATPAVATVGPRDCTRDLYGDGVPSPGVYVPAEDEFRSFRTDAGDGTVPIFSTALAGVDSAPPGAGEHAELVGEMAEPIVEFLLGSSVSSAASPALRREATETIPGAVIGLQVEGRLELLLEDPQGRRSGIEPSTGDLVDEIPRTELSAGAHGGSVAVAGAEPGLYTLQLRGPMGEDYRLRLACDDEDELSLHAFHRGEVSTMRFTVDETAVPCLQVQEPDPGVAGLRADLDGTTVPPTTLLSWSPSMDPEHLVYRVYARRGDEPHLVLLAETEGEGFETGHAWATSGEVSTRVYAVSSVDASGVESFLSAPATNDDRDHDGLTDEAEQDLGLPVDDPDADGDGLADGEEGEHGTDPLAWDTDGDGAADGAEVSAGSDPLRPGSTPDCPAGSELLVPAQEVVGERVFEACERIETEAGVAVGSGGRATFRTSGRVVFASGFSVREGGRLVVETVP